MYKYSIINNKTLFQLSKQSISFLQGNMYMFSKVKPHKKEKTREDFVTPVNSTQTCVKATLRECIYYHRPITHS